MRKYEMMYILDPTLDKEKTEALSAKIDEAISKQGASLESSEPWAGGRRRLAYPIKGHREGNYMLATLDAKPEAVGEIERRLRVMDGVPSIPDGSRRRAAGQGGASTGAA